MNIKKVLLAATAVAIALPCQHAMAKGNATTKSERKLLDPANMDTNVKPGDNFFLYANGAWLQKNPIPATETRWGSFSELQEFNIAALHTLLETAAKSNAAKGTKEQKVGDFYKSGMDTVAIEKAGITPLNEILTRISNLKTGKDVLKEIALEHTVTLNPLFSFGVGPDDKEVTKEICQFGQGGLGMPDRDYYLATDPRTTKIREAYKTYLVTMLKLAGETEADATQNAASIFALETKLAQASMTRVEMRDPYKMYNKFSVSAIDKAAPGIDMKGLLATLKIKGEDTVLIGQPEFFKAAAKELNETPVNTWKEYLKFHLVNDLAGYLSSKFDNARFNFYGKTMRGQQEQKPRWKRVQAVVDANLGELLGQLYVDKYFKPEAKKRMMELLSNLQTTYADRIQKLEWMSAPTKAKALGKLNSFMKKIGYPDKWRDFSSVAITKDNYIKNLMATSVFEYDYNISKLGKPVDRTEWGMTPPTVNAYYNPAFNEIVFPAGILQYPFFDFSADDAVNYGGIGAVIGHEMTHGFDDQGRQYDASGNLNDWWTADDANQFKQRADVVVAQFNESTVLDTVHVNGELTLGENLADLGGIAIAYEAFKKTPQGKTETKIDGFTPDQRFFLSWAQVWRANTRPEELAQRIKTDPHSPSELRCNIPLSNFDAFYRAFNIQPGQRLFREETERAKVW